MRLSAYKVRRIVSDYDDSSAAIAHFYDSDQDTDSDQEAAITLVEAEEEQLEVALDLYDEYLTLLSSALLNAPVLSELRFNEYQQVIFVPCHQVNRDDLMRWSERDRFFLRGLDDLVVPALSGALAGM